MVSGDERTATEAACTKPQPGSRCNEGISAVLCAVFAAALAVGLSCDGAASGGAGDSSTSPPDGDGMTGGMFGTGGLAGTGGSLGSGGSKGSFSWSGQGLSFSSVGYYEAAATADAQSLTFTISSDYSQLTIPCWLKGKFATVPPPAGMYPIVGAAAQDDGTFIGGCSTTGREATIYADPSVSGMVTLTQSTVGLVEGSFTMRTRPNPSFGGSGGSPGPMIDFTGMFSVGCHQPMLDPSCAARSVSPP